MSPTIFAVMPWSNRYYIYMKDLQQQEMLDNKIYGWPKTADLIGTPEYLDVGGFGFSAIDPFPPKMYFGLDSSLVWAGWPANGVKTEISKYVSKPVHLEVRAEGGQDVIYFCTRDGFWKYNFGTKVEQRLVIFLNNDWAINKDDEIDACSYLHNTDRIILIVRDKVGVWGLVAGVWTELFTPKKRFWYFYKVRVLELGNAGHFILYAKHAFMVLDSANLDAVHVWNREWDSGDWGSWNYVIQMGYGIAKFDVQNPYPIIFKEVKDVYKINSWDENSNDPIIIVKDTGELGTYVFSTGTFISLSTTNHFWDACFTTTGQKAVAVSWLPNAKREFRIQPNLWTANDHTKDWYLWYLDWSSGSLVSNSWGWNPKDGGAKAIKFFVQNGNPYLLFATKNTAYIRKYTENNQPYDTQKFVAEIMSQSTPGIWAVDKIQNSNIIICTSKIFPILKKKVRNNKDIRGAEFDDTLFTITMRAEAFKNSDSSISYATQPVANALLFFGDNRLSRAPILSDPCIVAVHQDDKDIGSFGICKLKSNNTYICTNAPGNFVTVDLDGASYPEVASSTFASSTICHSNCLLCNIMSEVCLTPAANTYNYGNHIYNSVCPVTDRYFSECNNSICQSNCSRSKVNYQSCYCQLAPKLYFDAGTLSCQDRCPAGQLTSLSKNHGYMCLSNAECKGLGWPVDGNKGICSDCHTGSNTIQLSDLTCITGCPTGEWAVSENGLRYCKETDRTVTFTDDSATTACTLTGSFGSDYFDPTKSEWSSASFIIGQIEDANNPATTFTFTVNGLGATSQGINAFQVSLTQPSEFDGPSKDLRIVLSASKTFGYLQSMSAMAKITGTATLSNFNCGCTGATPYRDVSSNTCVSACGSKYTGISSMNAQSCLTSAECTAESYPIDVTQGICSDCYTGSNTIQLSDLTCTSICASGDYSVSKSGLRYCKEHDKAVTLNDNSGTTPCTLIGSFGSDYFDPTKSEWSGASFIIQQIEDANNPATTFSFTVTGLGALSGGINGFQLNFTQLSEFSASSRDLKIVFDASKSFGYLQSASAMAKITGNATINNFHCAPANQVCTGATKYLDFNTDTCVSSCGSEYIGHSSAKGALCLTPSQCATFPLTTDSLQSVCSDCTAGTNSIQRSILNCIPDCGAKDLVTISDNLIYCAEQTSSLTFSDISETRPNTQQGAFSDSFSTKKSVWSNTNFIIDKITNSDNSKQFSFAIKGIGNDPLQKFELEFLNLAEFQGKTQTLHFLLKKTNFGFIDSENKFSSIFIANFLSFPIFSDTDSEISITQQHIKIYSIEFTFAQAKTGPNGSWKNQVSIAIPGLPPGSAFTYTVEKKAPNSLALILDFPNMDIDKSTLAISVVYRRPGYGTILRANKEFEIGIVKYNGSIEEAALVMRAVATVFEPISGVLAISGGAAAYIAFNKLFMINHFRLQMLYPVVFPKNYKVVLMQLVNPIGKSRFSALVQDWVGEPSFEGIYTSQTANTWIVRPRVYSWVSGHWTVTRMAAKALFVIFAINILKAPHNYCFGETVENCKQLKWFRNKALSYFFIAHFVAFFGLCLRCFGVFGLPGVAIDPTNIYLWLDLAILQSDLVCVVYVMDFMLRYAKGQNYSRFIPYMKGTLVKIMFWPNQDTESNPKIKYYNFYRNSMVGLMTLITYGLQSMPWVLILANILILGAWAVTIVRLNFFQSVTDYWWNIVHVWLLLFVHLGQIGFHVYETYGFGWNSYMLWANLQEYLLLALLAMEILETVVGLFNKCRKAQMRCFAKKVASSIGSTSVLPIIGGPVTFTTVVRSPKTGKQHSLKDGKQHNSQDEKSQMAKAPQKRSISVASRKGGNFTMPALQNDSGFDINPMLKKNHILPILPEDLGFIDHKQLHSTAGIIEANINTGLCGIPTPFDQKNEAILGNNFNASRRTTISTPKIMTTPSQNHQGLALPGNMPAQTMAESVEPFLSPDTKPRKLKSTFSSLAASNKLSHFFRPHVATATNLGESSRRNLANNQENPKEVEVADQNNFINKNAANPKSNITKRTRRVSLPQKKVHQRNLTARGLELKVSPVRVRKTSMQNPEIPLSQVHEDSYEGTGDTPFHSENLQSAKPQTKPTHTSPKKLYHVPASQDPNSASKSKSKLTRKSVVLAIPKPANDKPRRKSFSNLDADRSPHSPKLPHSPRLPHSPKQIKEFDIKIMGFSHKVIAKK